MSSYDMSDVVQVVRGLSPVTPSTSTPDYISLKNVVWCTVVIHCHNATTVTGSAITLLQATSVTAGGEKPLAFTTMSANIDCNATSVLTTTAVSANTFTTTAVNSKDAIYVIEVDPAKLDHNNSFDCLRAGTGNAVATTISVEYICQLKHGGAAVQQANLIVD